MIKLKWFPVFIVFALLFAVSHPLYAANDKTIVLASEEWKDATRMDGTGLYWDIFRAVFEPEGYTIKPKLCSYDASVRLVEEKKVDAMVGAYEEEFTEGIFPKTHFAVDVIQALYKKESISEWMGVESIKNKNVVWIKGYSYDDYLDKEVVQTTKMRKVDNRIALFRILDAGKADLALDAKADITDFLNDNPQYKDNTFSRKTFLELKLFVVFSKNEKGKKLAEIFDHNLQQLIDSGKLKEMYNNYSKSTFNYPENF